MTVRGGGGGPEEVSTEEVVSAQSLDISEDLLTDWMWVMREESGVTPRFWSLNI